jgi:hypothetical protein
MSDSFYFRVRGEVKGPFSREQIVSLIRKKRLGRHHELSTDAVIWTRAGEVDGLFESIAPAREEPEVGYATAVPETDSKQDTGAAQRSSSSGSSSEDDDDEWHYAKGRNTLGPISSNELRAMLATGRLLGSDRVWNSSLADWLPAEDLPQFMGSVREDSQRSRAGSTPRTGSGGGSSSYFDLVFGLSNGTSLPDGSLYKYPSLTRYLQISEGINRIFFVLGLLATAGWYIFLVAASGYTREGLMVAATIFVGFAGLLLSWLLLWFIFITAMAGLEFVRVFIKIEDNTSGSR